MPRRLTWGMGMLGLLTLLGGCKGSPSSPYPGAVDTGAVDTGPSVDRQLCQRSCDVFIGFVCPDQGPNCVEGCEARLKGGVCVAEIRAALECGIAAGASAFVCNVQNVTTLRPGFCQAEQAALFACLRPDTGG